MGNIHIYHIDLNTGESINESSYNYDNKNDDIFIEHVDINTGEYKSTPNKNRSHSYYSRITTLVEGSTSYIDLSESEAELLEKECEFADKLHEEYLDSCMDIGFGNLNELSMHDLKDKGRKAWDAIVDFFKRAIQYIQKKIRGQMDNLSVELDDENGEKFISFYAKAKRIKKIAYEENDKFDCVDVELANKYLSMVTIALNSSALDGMDSDNTDKELSSSIKNDTNINLDKYKKSGLSGKDWNNIRSDIFKKKVPANNLKTYIDAINKYYQKAIDSIHKVGKSAIKRAKQTPNKTSYKLYLNAKHISAASLNINGLIKVNNDN